MTVESGGGEHAVEPPPVARQPVALSPAAACSVAVALALGTYAATPLDVATQLLPFRLFLVLAAVAAQAYLFATLLRHGARLCDPSRRGRLGRAALLGVGLTASWLLSSAWRFLTGHALGGQWVLELAAAPLAVVFLWACARVTTALAARFLGQARRLTARDDLRDVLGPAIVLLVALATDYSRFVLLSGPVRLYLVALLGLGAALTVSSRLAASPLRPLKALGIVGLVGLCALFVWFDATLYRRLYDAMHVAAWLGAVFAAARIGGEVLPRARPAVSSPAVSSPIASWRAASWRPVVAFGLFLLPMVLPGIRFELLERLSPAGRVATVAGVRLASWGAIESAPRTDLASLRTQPDDAAPARPDIFFVSVDALRADFVTEELMPHTTAFARRGARFLRARTHCPSTHPTLSSLLSGAYPSSLFGKDAQGKGGEKPARPASARAWLWDALAEAGYHTRFVGGLARHFYVARHVQESVMIRGRDDDAAVDAALEVMSADTPESPPTFLWVHLDAPHSAYRPVKRPTKTGARALYTACVKETDARLARLFSALTERAAQRPWVVVFFADHGEEFGDHGGQFHGSSCYEEQVRVPLAFVGAGIVAPGRAGAEFRVGVSLLDVTPTLFDLLQIDSAATFHGRSLLPAIRGEQSLPERPLLLRIGASRTGRGARGVVLQPWKLIANDVSGTLELYHLGLDPRETVNRIRDLDQAPAELPALLGLEPRPPR